LNTAKDKLNSYLEKEGMRRSQQREQILDEFLASKRHLTAEELYDLVKEKYPEIGQATVYRALKLFCEANICRTLNLQEGPARYEAIIGHEHHDHLICLDCGRFEEVVSPRIEELQQKLAEAKGYKLKEHRLVLYGLCSECRS